MQNSKLTKQRIELKQRSREESREAQEHQNSSETQRTRHLEVAQTDKL